MTMSEEVIDVHFRIGDEVFALLDDNEYMVKGKVIRVNPGVEYRIQFDTGVERDVSVKDVKRKVSGKPAPKVRARPSKRSTKSRSKSRSRSSGRTPRRRTRSTSRQPRKTASPKKVSGSSSERRRRSRSVSKSPPPSKKRGKKTTKRAVERKKRQSPRRSPRRPRSSPSPSPEKETLPTPKEPIVTKPAQVALTQLKRVVAEPTTEPAPPPKVPEVPAPKELPKKPGKPVLQSAGEFISSISLILITPAIVYYTYFVCAQPEATVLKLPTIPSSFGDYINGQAIAVYFLWAILQAVLMVLPVGEVAVMPGRRYRLNGFFALLVNVLLLCVGAYTGLLPLRGIYPGYLQMMGASLVFALVFTAVLSLHGMTTTKKQPATARPGSFLTKFVEGFVVNPRFGPAFDVKMYLFRLGMIGWATVILGLVHHNYVKEGCFKDSVLISAAFQMFYIVIFYLWEGRSLTTYTFQREGVGYVFSVGACTVMPFLQAVQLRHQLSHPHHVPLNCFLMAFILFPTGAYIFIKSNGQKHKYRQDPYSSEFAMYSIHHSTNFLCSGWWGCLRHPNYLGDLLMHFAWGLMCGCQYSGPYLPTFITINVLVARALLVERDCKRRYGPRWDEYCATVRCRMVPFIF